MSDKKTILSGIQPSGKLCIANQLGAINNWVSLQDDYNSIFLIVDLLIYNSSYTNIEELE